MGVLPPSPDSPSCLPPVCRPTRALATALWRPFDQSCSLLAVLSGLGCQWLSAGSRLHESCSPDMWGTLVPEMGRGLGLSGQLGFPLAFQTLWMDSTSGFQALREQAGLCPKTLMGSKKPPAKGPSCKIFPQILPKSLLFKIQTQKIQFWGRSGGTAIGHLPLALT